MIGYSMCACVCVCVCMYVYSLDIIFGLHFAGRSDGHKVEMTYLSEILVHIYQVTWHQKTVTLIYILESPIDTNMCCCPSHKYSVSISPCFVLSTLSLVSLSRCQYSLIHLSICSFCRPISVQITVF